MLDLRDVAYNVAHDSPGGLPSLAPRLGVNATTLAHELNGTGAAKLGLLMAERITQRTGDMRILEAFACNCGHMIVPLPGLEEAPQDDCMVRMAEMAKEFGALCNEVAGDLSQGQISDNALKRIDRECGLMIAAVHNMREALAQRNRHGKPEIAKLDAK